MGEEVRAQFISRFSEGEGFFVKAHQSSSTLAARYPMLSPAPQPSGLEGAPTPAWRFDLVAAARAQFQRAGVPQRNVEVAELCTACRTDLFFSHRQEGSGTGRMMAVIGIRS